MAESAGTGRCNFTVGQRVVCVKPRPWDQTGYPADIIHPEDGSIYTIREIYLCPGSGVVGLRFKELKNPFHPTFNIEYGYHFIYFRSLDERKTDISIFTKMLTGKHEPASA